MGTVLVIGLVWGALELAAFAILYQWDFYYLLPFPVTEPNAAFTFEGDLRPKVTRKDLRLTSWIVPDPELIWRLRPDLELRVENMNLSTSSGGDYRYFDVISNSRGFRTPEFMDAKQPGVLRVVGIGDSNVFGWAVDEKYSFLGILREKLEPLGVEVINLGVAGYTSTQGVALFEEEVLPLKPDFFIVWLGENDNYSLTRETDSELIRFNGTVLGRVNNFCFVHSFVFRLMHKLISGLSQRSDREAEMVPRVPLDEFKRNMEYFAERCRAKGVEAIFMLHYRPSDPYQQVVHSVARKYGYPFVPIRELYRSATQGERLLPKPPPWELFEKDIVQQWIIPVDGHPTFRGHQLIADELYAIISAKIRQKK